MVFNLLTYMRLDKLRVLDCLCSKFTQKKTKIWMSTINGISRSAADPEGGLETGQGDRSTAYP